MKLSSSLLAGTAMWMLAAQWSPALAGCNSGNVAKDNLLSSANCQADAGTDFYSTAVGRTANAGFGSAAVGGFAQGTGDDASAIGTFSSAFGQRSVALGSSSWARGRNALSIGYQAGDQIHDVDGAISVGAGAQALGVYSTALGITNTDNGFNAIPTTVEEFYGIAIGGGDGRTTQPYGATKQLKVNGARARTQFSIAIGSASLARGRGSVTVGSFSEATAADSAAFGENSIATGVRGIAIGAGSTATGDNSVAIGANSAATASNVVSFGSHNATRRLMNVTNGVAAHDAVNVAQLNAAIAAAAHQPESANANNDEVAALRREVAELRAAVDTLRQGRAAALQR